MPGFGPADPLATDLFPAGVYRGLLETVSDAIVSIDARQTIVLFNKQAERLFGYSRQEALGQPLSLLLPRAVHDAHAAHVRAFGAESGTQRRMGETLDLAALHKNGETFPVEVSIARLEHGDATLFTAVVRDLASRRRAERLIRSVTEATSIHVGGEFFRSLVRGLAEANGVTTAYLSLFVGAGTDRLRTMAFWHDGRYLDNFEYSLAKTPCEAVLQGGICYEAGDVQVRFPGDPFLVAERMRGYMGLALRDSTGEALGVMAFMDRRPIGITAGVEAALRVFAVRASVEIQRRRIEADLGESEARFRAHYKNSPLAIVTWRHEHDTFRLSDYNLAAERQVDEPIAGLVGQELSEVWGHQPALVADVWRSFRERTTVEREVDYVFRPTGRRAWLAVRMAFVPPNMVVVYAEDITARRQAEEEIRRLNADLEARVRDRTSEIQASQARLAEAQQIAHVGSWEYDPGTGLLLRSAEACRILGVPPETRDRFSPMAFERVHPDDLDHLLSAIRTTTDTLEPASLTCRIRRPDGAERVVSLRTRAVIDPPGTPLRLVGTVQDVTEERATQRELLRRGELLRQSQKLEAVGRLAGGVAHDFNNLLTIIRGHAEELIGSLTAPDSGQRRTDAIVAAVDRLAALTAELLAFGRQQPHQPTALDLNDVIRATEGMLTRLGGRRNSLVRVAGSGLGRIRADRGQIRQVLLNLVANARDAMPEGGPITIETGNVQVDDPLADRLGAPEGDYVTLVVRDTGVGMDAGVQAHVFEPFFTTKAFGKGAGLGLSTVHGIVQQSGGYVAIDSAPGQGTSVAIYFPRFPCHADEDTEAATGAARAPHTPPDQGRGGGETILLAEDEGGVLEMVSEFLESRGYHVLTGSDGAAALARAEAYAGPIHLLLTDVVMPVMNGPELAERIRRVRPETRVLFMSGCASGSTLVDAVQRSGSELIRKPFALDALAQVVRDTVDSAG